MDDSHKVLDTNLLISDTSNNTIRKLVVATGTVTTLAGGPSVGSNDGIGTAARFESPTGVVSDGTGNLLVADFGNSTVRKIQLASGSVSTVIGIARQPGVQLGQLPAGLNNPVALATLPGGSLAILDENSVLLVR